MSFEIFLGFFVGIPFGMLVGVALGAHLEQRAWQDGLAGLAATLSPSELVTWLENIRRERAAKDQP